MKWILTVLLTVLTINTVLGLDVGLKYINNARERYNLPKVTQNVTVENMIKEFNSKINGSIIDFYYTNSKTHNYTYIQFPNKTRRWNADFIMEYMGLDRDGWEFSTRDRTHRTIKYIVGFRLNQMSCFNWNKCSDTFSDYTTCTKQEPVWKPDEKCSWAWQYASKYLQKRFYQTACVYVYNIGYNPQFNRTGGGLQENYKPKAYVCYQRIRGKIISDNPLLG